MKRDKLQLGEKMQNKNQQKTPLIEKSCISIRRGNSTEITNTRDKT
jgi:hypothetical protein